MPRKTSEVLEDIKKALDSINTSINDLGGQLTQRSSEFFDAQREAQSAHLEVESLRREIAEVRALARTVRSQAESAGQGASSSTTAGGDGHDYEDLLSRAAGVAYAELLCHRDTWAFLVEQSSRGEHFRLPVDIDADDDGRIEVDISGRTLTAAIDALWQTRCSSPTPATGHLAAQIYTRIGDALQEVDDDAGGGDGRVVRIVIDDRRPGSASGGTTGSSETESGSGRETA
jgi:hypothetical protein